MFFGFCLDLRDEYTEMIVMNTTTKTTRPPQITMVIKASLDIIGKIIFSESIVCPVVDGTMFNLGVVDFGVLNFVFAYSADDSVCNIVEPNVVVFTVVDQTVASLVVDPVVVEPIVDSVVVDPIVIASVVVDPIVVSVVVEPIVDSVVVDPIVNSTVVAFVVVGPIVVSMLETCVSLLVEVVLESVDVIAATVEVDSKVEASSLVLDVVVVLESDVVCSTESQVTGE